MDIRATGRRIIPIITGLIMAHLIFIIGGTIITVGTIIMVGGIIIMVRVGCSIIRGHLQPQHNLRGHLQPRRNRGRQDLAEAGGEVEKAGHCRKRFSTIHIVGQRAFCDFENRCGWFLRGDGAVKA